MSTNFGNISITFSHLESLFLMVRWELLSKDLDLKNQTTELKGLLIITHFLRTTMTFLI